MKPGWVAGSARARALARRRLGAAGSRSVATASFADAVTMVAGSPYGHSVTSEMSLTEAQRGVWATALWDLRVLAGWLVAGGADMVRILAGGFEIANIESQLGMLAGGRDVRPFELGPLATIWPRVRGCRSSDEVRHALAASPWGDPGTTEPARLAAALRLAWARRVSDSIPRLRRWAAAAGALIVAGERFVGGRTLGSSAGRDARRLLGPACEGVDDVAGFADALGGDARWVLADIDDGEALWQGEARWWNVTAEAALAALGRAQPGEVVVESVAVVLLTDAHRVCGALEAAAWGRAGAETFDALA